MTYSRSAAKLPPGHHDNASHGPSAGFHGCSLRIDKQSHCSRDKHTKRSKLSNGSHTCSGKNEIQKSQKCNPVRKPPCCFSIHFSFSNSPTEHFHFHQCCFLMVSFSRLKMSWPLAILFHCFFTSLFMRLMYQSDSSAIYICNKASLHESDLRWSIMMFHKESVNNLCHGELHFCMSNLITDIQYDSDHNSVASAVES